MGKTTTTKKTTTVAKKAAAKVAPPEAVTIEAPAPAPVSKPKRVKAAKPAAVKPAAEKPSAPKKAATPKAPRKKAAAMAKTFTAEDIALRAYFIAEKRQQMGQWGTPETDWLEAERQLREELAK